MKKPAKPRPAPPPPPVSMEFALSQVRRLCSKQGWPFYDEGQSELARVVVQYSRNEAHARDVITWLCENSDRCPASHELRYELRGPGLTVPETPKNCRLKLCDGRGWIEVFSLETLKEMPGGACFKERTMISRDQYNELAGKINWEQQQVYTGVKKCECRA